MSRLNKLHLLQYVCTASGKAKALIRFVYSGSFFAILRGANMYEEIISALTNAEKIGIFTHVNPDGDAMGSSYSLKLALRNIGKCAEVFLAPEPDAAPMSIVIGLEEKMLPIEQCDLLVALDCADSKRLGMYQDIFLNHPNTIAIDHHVTHQPYAKNWIMRDLSSTCELMTELYEEMGTEITRDIANNLYIGLSSDTGNFKYSCVTGDTLGAAAKLISTGIDFAAISKRLFDTKRREYYDLMKIALDRLEFYEDGKVCVLYLEQEDFVRSDIKESEATGIVTLPSSIECVMVGVYIRKRDDGECKVSLRSVDVIDVAKIAVKLGGGGHMRASGFSAFDKTAREITEMVIAEVKKQM